MSTRKRSVWHTASMAIALLALTIVLSSCLVGRPWQQHRWDRYRDAYQQQPYEQRDLPRPSFPNE